MSALEILTTDHFTVLACMYDNKDKEDVAKLTQQEIADLVCLSRPTISSIFKALKSEELIDTTSFVGRYHLTKKGIKAVETFRKIN